MWELLKQVGCPTFRGVPIKRRFCACWGRVVQFDAKVGLLVLSSVRQLYRFTPLVAHICPQLANVGSNRHSPHSARPASVSTVSRMRLSATARPRAMNHS